MLRLETERLILRSWRAEDLDDIIEGLNNYNVSRWLTTVPFPYERKDGEEWLEHCACMDADGNRMGYELAAELKASGKVIGGVSMLVVSARNGISKGGIWLSENFHGMGYGKEIFGVKIRYTFAELGMRKIEDGFFVGNEASRAMQESLGYTIEGTRRQAYLCAADGEYKDEVITGLLKEEWDSRRR